MREEPVYPFEFLFVGVVGISERFYLAAECVFDIRLQPAVDDIEFFEVCENCDRSIPVPSVSHGLIEEIGIMQLPGWFLCLDVELRIAEVRREEESVVGSLLGGANLDAVLDLDFVLVRVLLPLVSDVPAECREEFIYEVLADLGFLISRREVIPLMRPEVFD